MKKQILMAGFSLFIASNAFSQDAIADKIREETCKTIEKDIAANLKNTQDVKKGLKASTWMKLAQNYEDMSLQCGKDSMSSAKAYETYLKAQEIDKAAGGKSAKDIATAIAPTSKLKDALMSQGAALYNGKNLKGALSLFKLVNAINPKDTTATLYAGIVAQQSKDYASAKEYFGKYIEQGAKDPAVYYSLAAILKNEKEGDKAVEVLKKGIAINPNDKDLKGELINTYLSTGKLDDAITDLKKLIEADPSNVNNLLNLGILYDNSGKKADAEEIYKQVLAKDPQNYDCSYNLGVLYLNQAVEIKKEVDKMDMKTYQKEGKLVEEKACNRFAQAKPFFDNCKKIKPAETEVDENLGNIDRILTQCGKK